MNTWSIIPTANEQQQKNNRLKHFQNWLHDNQLDFLDVNENEELEHILKEYNPEQIIKKQPQLEMVDYSQIDKNGLPYNLLFNTIADPNNHDEIGNNSGYYNKITPVVNENKYNFTLPTQGDIITDMYLVVPENTNLNILLTAKVELNIGGTPCITTTLLFLVYIATLFGQTIIKKNDKDGNESYFIPIIIAKIFMDGKLDLSKLSYQNKIIYVGCSQPIKISYLNVKYIFVNIDKLRAYRDISDKIVTFSNKSNILRSSNPFQYHIDNIKCPMFICLWYIVDTTNYSELQGLQPMILSAKLDIKYDNQTYQKVIDISKINKIIVRNYVGYLIPVNNLSCKQFERFVHNHHKSLDKFWENQNVYIDLNIEWDNCHHNADILVEMIGVDTGIIANSMFSFMS
ncbi:hypothetical protein Klosneuvirus_3_257 [Klosneuvirus KNV1]|uniref:Uncharacterized protein n=1 Tax=Klosneuvirus KNV1 TaxID=1977640 RepID=A0A1V0SK81_9VIRU|nr:hypothetical protein Klosneuvirus_3_257 [Klosneuvirus KNV1]